MIDAVKDTCWEIESLEDGVLHSSHDAVTNVPEAEVARLTGVPAGSSIPIVVRAFLLRSAAATVLIDTGAGPQAPGLGRLPDALRARGVEPGDVDHIVLTHIHSDHSNGLLDARGEAAFPNAELVLHECEAGFWLGALPPGAGERIERNFRAAKRVTAPYRDRLRTVAEGGGLPGLSAMLEAGHTPGHCGWRVETRAEPVLVWGDIVHFPRVQVPVPDAALVYDVDPAAAAATRRRVFETVARENLLVAGSHLEGSGFARLERRGARYHLLPD